MNNDHQKKNPAENRKKNDGQAMEKPRVYLSTALVECLGCGKLVAEGVFCEKCLPGNRPLLEEERGSFGGFVFRKGDRENPG